MHRLIAVTLLLAASTAWGQNVKVIPLSQEDAEQRQWLEQKRAAIDKEIAEFDEKVADQYTRFSVNKNSYCSSSSGMNYVTNGKCIKLGWQNGFEYSDDFKFIVPKGPLTAQGPSFVHSCWNGNCIIPATNDNIYYFDGNTPTPPVSGIKH